MRGAVVVLVEERAEADLDVVQGGDRTEVVEAAAAQGQPEALHFAPGLRVVPLGMEQRDAEPLAAERSAAPR